VKFDHLRQARPPVSCREVYVRALTDIPSLWIPYSNTQLCPPWSQSSTSVRTCSWMYPLSWWLDSWRMGCFSCPHLYVCLIHCRILRGNWQIQPPATGQLWTESHSESWAQIHHHVSIHKNWHSNDKN
jgi:hypothetical protein